ncbi:MAG TPA: hypothetical protein PKA00_23145 [Saprospiraceae bacterium]|nr:hypothetical protein [Saprospiraceae bacterium]HMQ85825.1 hypothetical protein [Saprospiraceae bacterium]
MLLCLIATNLNAQKDNWILYPNRAHFNPNPIFSPLNFSNPSSSLQTPYVVENSVYENGNLLFYIQNGSIFSNDGSTAGTFSDETAIKKEIGIAPVPNQCRTYCIFFLETLPLTGMYFNFVETVINNNGQIVAVNGPVNMAIYSGNHGSLAVSQVIEGTQADRHIYVVSNAQGIVQRYLMNASGLANQGTVATFHATNKEESEAELSPCGRFLAWSVDDIAYVQNLQTGQQYHLELGGNFISGLEFESFASGCNDLFITHPNLGLVQWTFASGTHSTIPGTQSYNLTQLEMGKDGFMYLVRNGGSLWRFDPSIPGNSFQLVTEFPISSNRYGGATEDVYALPDQIDGEGDDSFYGIQPLVISDIILEPFSLPQTVADAPVLYDCGPIDLALEYEGQAMAYSINIVSVDPSTGTPVYGVTYLDYTASFSGAPNFPIDIRCLDDPTLCDLFDDYLGQTFLLSMALSDRCGKTVASGYFKVFGSPGGPENISWEIEAGDGPVGTTPSTNINTPVSITPFGTLDFSNTLGDISFVQLVIQEVNCSNGSPLGLLYDNTFEYTSSATQLAYNLAALEINGTNNYFQNNNYDVLEKCIRVDVTLGNNCGSASAYTYLQFREISPSEAFLHNNGSNAGIQNSLGFKLAKAWPNPVKDGWQLGLVSEQEDMYQLRIFDAQGRLLFEQTQYLASGYQLIECDLSGLPAGVCYYHLSGAYALHSGTFLKF